MRQLRIVGLFLLVTGALISVSLATGQEAEKKRLLEVAEKSPDFKTLVQAIGVAELQDALKGDGPFTIFAPTNEAFSTLGDNTVAQLLIDQRRVTNFKKLLRDDGHLHAILTFHVVKGELREKDLRALAKDGKSLETLNGAKIKLSLDGEKIKLGNATITTTDLTAKNGVIHVINGVLLPPAPRQDTKYIRARTVPTCPPADEPFIWQRATTLASPKSDRELLVTLWEKAMAETPPRGDADKWKAKTKEIVAAAKTYASETDQKKAGEAASALVRKVNCLSCHAEHQKTPFSRD